MKTAEENRRFLGDRPISTPGRDGWYIAQGLLALAQAVEGFTETYRNAHKPQPPQSQPEQFGPRLR